MTEILWPPVFWKGVCYPAYVGPINPRENTCAVRVRASVCDTLCLENQGCYCSGWKGLQREEEVSLKSPVSWTWPQAHLLCASHQARHKTALPVTPLTDTQPG